MAEVGAAEPQLLHDISWQLACQKAPLTFHFAALLGCKAAASVVGSLGSSAEEQCCAGQATARRHQLPSTDTCVPIF